MFVEAIRDILTADADVTGGLATYQFTSGVDAAAIFTIDPIPENAELPAIVVTTPSAGTYNTCDRHGVELDIDVRIFGNRQNQSIASLHTTAWAIYDALSLPSLSVAGYDDYGVIASPPTRISDPDGFPGYLVSAQLRAIVS